MLFTEAAQFGDDGEGAELYEGVADQIEEDSGVGCGCATFGISGEIGDGGEGYQDVARVRDGAVGEHALYVGLHERAEIAHKHRKDREDPEGPEPEMRRGGNRGVNAQEQGEGGGFGARGEERGDGGG